jgi:hypothetical protein
MGSNAISCPRLKLFGYEVAFSQGDFQGEGDWIINWE